MKIEPTQGSAKAPMRSVGKPSVPKGLSEVRDRLSSSLEGREEPPSQFKKFLFDPIFFVISFVFRELFRPLFWIKNCFIKTPVAIEDPSLERDRDFLERLELAPRAKEIFLQFERHFSNQERDEIYRMTGSKYSKKLSWREYIWDRSVEQNIALGYRLVRNNPERIRDHLARRIPAAVR